ncbi:MAG: hypothetical protein JWQ90_5216 [Hydrocarboniphaga sp.]|uniref:choice-of-anchor tandem repeat GloVer-containing protein n=1 Tax=Hydrocarboniphaga sp. TaxID=2033016 RepID=UPI00260C913B|nr:choice-of-anchor tandem repeat GloVer-containing protein [Hydrocarboniphaga sp.]MDB5972766.1 hypothetical protein [Hydrocarboniphaga sp.]
MKGNRLASRSIGATLLRVLRNSLIGALLFGGSTAAIAAQPDNLYVFYFGEYATGLEPQSGLTLGSDGNFYGTTWVGGANWGTVYRITPAGTITLLHAFDSTNGDGPIAPLVQTANGKLWGTTQFGGNPNCIYGCGVIFKMNTDGSGYKVVHFFTGKDGETPRGIILASDGKLYGVTATDSNSGQGTIFVLDPASGALRTLYQFRRPIGSNPYMLIEGSDGNLYGTTLYGSPKDAGILFRMTKTGVLTTLHRFGGSSGTGPTGIIQAQDGSFYGTTFAGGTGSCTVNSFPGCGTVFKYDSSGQLSMLYSFSGADGAAPYHGLIQASDGLLYGATEGGGQYQDDLCEIGAQGCGTVFKLTLAGKLTTLASFNINLSGEGPQGVIEGLDGALYGATESGGLPPPESGYTFGAGTVFHVTRP